MVGSLGEEIMRQTGIVVYSTRVLRITGCGLCGIQAFEQIVNIHVCGRG